jgi:GNAT superfamily N-acetyltransferase
LRAAIRKTARNSVPYKSLALIMPHLLDIRPLRRDDIPGALRLSTQAGWNQIEADWQRLIDLWPESCIAGWHKGQLVATATLAIYGTDLAWVGMILVDEACRGQGFGGQIMDAIIALGDRAGIKTLGLDATDLGRPVYLKRGFVDICGIDRRVISAADAVEVAGHAADWRACTLSPEEWPHVLALDYRLTGIDRSPLLNHLRKEPAVRVQVYFDRIAVRGFACCRRGRVADHIGPVVAESSEIALDLIDSFTFQTVYSEERPIMLDTFRDPSLMSALDGRRYVTVRRLTRMARPAHIELPQPAAAAGFELG